jgi:hypothetical protein
MLRWLYENRVWVFSGCGVAIVAGIISWIRSRRGPRDPVLKQSQTAGSNSRMYQAGRDITLGEKGEKKRGE